MIALASTACASPGMPPGGPPDVAAPQLVAVAPDTGRTRTKPKEVIFRFDEIVAERPPGVTTLADLFLISPRDGTPDVSWHREEIAVRPRRGWRPNTTYTVTMLRGIADLRGNVRNTGASTFFSTGPSIPRTHVTGTVFDWVAGTPASGSLVEALVPPDTTHAYVAVADSSGQFSLEHLAAGRYMVRAFVDRNRNRGIDPGESWDSVTVDLTDSAAAELFIFAHDSLPPRIRDVAAIDSLSLRVTFDKPVDPQQSLTSANFSVTGPDSATVPIAGVGPVPKDTIATPAPSRAVQSRPPVRVPRDTTTKARPVMSRPAPIASVLIRLERPLVPKSVYRIRAIGLRGLLGQSGDSEHAYTVPAPAPPAPAKSTPPPAGTTPPPVNPTPPPAGRQ
jgi:hypothetical protein